MNNGGPAFPSQASMRDDWYGMSLRDYFAAAALNGRTPAIDESWDDVAALCYWIADRMLAERDKS